MHEKDPDMHPAGGPSPVRLCERRAAGVYQPSPSICDIHPATHPAGLSPADGDNNDLHAGPFDHDHSRS